MTTPFDPPVARDRADIRAIRFRGTAQCVFGAVALAFAVVALVQGAAWWTVAIAVLAGVLLLASGAFAYRVAAGRLARLEGRSVSPATGASGTDAAGRPTEPVPGPGADGAKNPAVDEPAPEAGTDAAASAAGDGSVPAQG